jgi:hypothetical protein
MKPKSPAAGAWKNYEFAPAFVLGFHGCDATTGEAILRGEIPHLNSSEHDYDWLGTGIYFWEGNPARALEFAQESADGGRNSQGKIKNPFVLGAVINLGRCLDLADSSAIAQVENAYETLRELSKAQGEALPKNSKDLKARRLDCYVFNALHGLREAAKEEPYDTVRGLFWEDDEIYPGAGLRRGNHIQICVREPRCILGYFRPILASD